MNNVLNCSLSKKGIGISTVLIFLNTVGHANKDQKKIGRKIATNRNTYLLRGGKGCLEL